MQSTLMTLAKIHYELGLIDYDEFNERFGVALWLTEKLPVDIVDPRDGDKNNNSPINEDDTPSEPEQPSITTTFEINGVNPKDDDENWLELLCLNTWVFTKSDPDSYPSVPHGHYKSQNNKWPKLNPYTGRVFSGKHLEDRSKRLSKRQMNILWSSEKLKTFCREMIVWYQEQFPYYDFPVRRPLRMPKW